jgi:S1-C subfamily serine protease
MKALSVSIAFLILLVGTVGCSNPSVISPQSQPTSPVTSAPTPTPTTQPIVTATVTLTLPPTSVSIPSIASIVANTSPAVVRVTTKSGMGSGMIIDKAGYVLTNSHVIEGNDTVTVILSNGQELNASILGRDEITDLAILKVSRENLPVVTLGDSDKLGQGEEVIAIGYPLDLVGSATISRGIVSAFRNDTGVDYIQTDSAINPGNSGGPLLNLKGEVVGVNVMTIRLAAGLPIQGMNFAIAINSVKPIIPKLIAGISVLKPTPEPKPWITYTSDLYGYSIQYPNTLVHRTLDKSYGMDFYSSDGKLIVWVHVPKKTADSLDSQVDFDVYYNSQNSLLFQVLSRNNLTWQGMYEALEFTYLLKLDEEHGGYAYKCKVLYLKRNGYLFQINTSAPPDSYELYSSTIDTIINSFLIIK